MNKRTVIDFDSADDIWTTIDQWAEESSFRKKEAGESRRLYQKGVGFLVAPMMPEISKDGKKVHLEAWVRANLLVRIFALFLIPSEMGIEPGGFKMAVPRKMARNAINKLLEKLGQPAIA